MKVIKIVVVCAVGADSVHIYSCTTMSNSVQNKDDSMNVPDQMDVVKDELDIKDELDVNDDLGVEDDLDVKDELEPIVGSSTDLMTTEFKDEFRKTNKYYYFMLGIGNCF